MNRPHKVGYRIDVPLAVSARSERRALARLPWTHGRPASRNVVAGISPLLD